MMRPLFAHAASCLAVCLLALSSASAADLKGLDLAKARNCLGCHRVDGKLVGPSYQSVAARFAADPAALDKLQTAIRKGSQGQWGAIPMPAQPRVTEAEAKELAQWVLSLKR